MAKYQTREGDTLDQICFDFYGSSSGFVEIVLEANPLLAEAGLVFPIGVEIELPDVPKNPVENLVQVFD